jgi:hypothetical protein
MLLLKPSNIFEKCVIKHSYDNNVNSKIIESDKTHMSEQNDTIIKDTISDEPNLGENNTDTVEELSDESNNLEKVNESNEPIHLEKMDESDKITHLEKMDESEDICEVEFNLDEIEPTETVQLKNRNDVYYKMYKEARQKAKDARDLALSSFLEAKRIKNTYMLDDIDSDSDLDEESLHFEE